MEITLVDGRRLRTSLRDVVPATEAEIRNRCREAASMVLGAGRAEEVEAAMDGHDGLADAGLVPRLCAATGPAARH